MNTLTKIILCSTIPLALSGCESLVDNVANVENEEQRLCATASGEFYQCDDMPVTMKEAYKDPSLFKTNINFQMLSDYTEQMAFDIKRDLKGQNLDSSIVVASFVYFDDNLKTTNALGNQLSEYFINDLQALGLPVSDHKLSSGVNVSPDGDFSLSRNIEELNVDIDIGYVLTGTMIEDERGIIVNARMISRKSNRVVASVSKLLPNLLVTQML